MNTVKAIYLEETKNYAAKLPGGVYRIDGKVVTLKTQEEVNFKSLKNVVRLTMTSTLTQYTSVNEETLSVEDYEKNLYQLRKNAENYDYDWHFEDLDEEYAYKKFKRKWLPVRKSIVTDETEILFEIETLKISTDNPYITPLYLISGEISGVYIYNQNGARMGIFRDLITELKLVASEDKGSNTYHIPTHSGLRYAKVCGSYVFSDKWSDKRGHTRGTLEHLETLYNDDLENMTDIVKSKYNIVNLTVSLSLDEYETELRQLISKLYSIDSKAKTYTEWQNTIRYAEKMINKFHKETAKTS